VVALDDAHEVLGVRQVLDRLHVEVRPEVCAELEAGLRHGVGRAEALINGEPAVEPLALHVAAAGDDCGDRTVRLCGALAGDSPAVPTDVDSERTPSAASDAASTKDSWTAPSTAAARPVSGWP